MSEPTALSAETVEALRATLCLGVPDVECDHVDGVVPCCERDARALAPIVARLIREATTEARAETKALRERVEAECRRWDNAPVQTPRAVIHSIRAALSLPADTPEEGRWERLWA